MGTSFESVCLHVLLVCRWVCVCVGVCVCVCVCVCVHSLVGGDDFVVAIVWPVVFFYDY